MGARKMSERMFTRIAFEQHRAEARSVDSALRPALVAHSDQRTRSIEAFPGRKTEDYPWP